MMIDPLSHLDELDRERQCYALLLQLAHAERAYRQFHELKGPEHEMTGRAMHRLAQAGDLSRVFLSRHRHALDDDPQLEGQGGP